MLHFNIRNPNFDNDFCTFLVGFIPIILRHTIKYDIIKNDKLDCILSDELEN